MRPLSSNIYHLSSKKGFTLIEVLVVVMIIAILAVMAMFMLMNHLAKGRDGARKTDLDRLKIAFEEYYGDKNTYPDDNILQNCGSDALRPYLSSIPCDPKTNRPYCYIYDADAPVGQNYRILTSLEYLYDPIISDLNCQSQTEYCGFESECSAYGSRFNYGVVSSDMVVVNDYVISGGFLTSSPSPSPSSLPLPSTTPGIYACSPSGVCNNYAPDPATNGCPLTWNDSVACGSYCPTSPAYARCTN